MKSIVGIPSGTSFYGDTIHFPMGMPLTSLRNTSGEYRLFPQGIPMVSYGYVAPSLKDVMKYAVAHGMPPISLWSSFGYAIHICKDFNNTHRAKPIYATHFLSGPLGATRFLKELLWGCHSLPSGGSIWNTIQFPSGIPMGMLFMSMSVAMGMPFVFLNGIPGECH